MLKSSRHKRDTVIRIIIIGVLILLSPILLPVLAVLQIYDRLSLRAFRYRHAGNLYFICTSRHDWYDFLRNNVIPIIPDNVSVIWYGSKDHYMQDDFFYRLSQSNICGHPKPYLVAVTKKGIHAKSLHSEFRKLKTCSKRSEAIQAGCKGIIEARLNELFTKK